MISHYLMFNGNCKEAIDMYIKAFDGKINNISFYKDMPENPDFPIPEEMKEKVLNCSISLDGFEIMCADANDKLESGNNQYISVVVNNLEFVKQAFDILKEEGYVYMDLEPTFFATGHGSLRDKFGVNWMFTALKPIPTEE